MLAGLARFDQAGCAAEVGYELLDLHASRNAVEVWRIRCSACFARSRISRRASRRRDSKASASSPFSRTAANPPFSSKSSRRSGGSGGAWEPSGGLNNPDRSALPWFFAARERVRIFQGGGWPASRTSRASGAAGIRFRTRPSLSPPRPRWPSGGRRRPVSSSRNRPRPAFRAFALSMRCRSLRPQPIRLASSPRCSCGCVSAARAPAPAKIAARTPNKIAGLQPITPLLASRTPEGIG